MAEEFYGRVHWYRPEELDEDQRVYYDALTSGPRDLSQIMDSEGRLMGAFNARFLHPRVGMAIQQVSAELRYGSETLTPRETELVILTVSRVEKSNFEFIAHSVNARKAGFGDEHIESLRAGTEVLGLSDAEKLVLRVTDELLAHADLDDSLFQEVVDVLGRVKLFDVITLVAHYRHTAMSMRVWRVPPQPATELPFPDGHLD